MPNGPDISGVVNDPKFLGLSPDDQRGLLARLTGDNSFQNLDNAGLFKFTSRFKLEQPADMTFAGNQFPQLKSDQLSRTNFNMAAALSGQKQATPEDQEQFQSGKKAGYVSAATQAGLGAVGAPLTAPTVTSSTVGTGILDSSGQEVVREVLSHGPSVARQALSNPVAQKLLWRVVGPVAGVALLKELGLLRKAGQWMELVP
jgi:hypothetical protein